MREKVGGGRIEHEKTPTLRSNMGDNQLSVAYEEKNVRHLENQGGGVERDCYNKQAGKGALVQWEKSATLGVSQDQTLFVFTASAQNTQANQEELDIKQNVHQL